jgi:hypothetical protein
MKVQSSASGKDGTHLLSSRADIRTAASHWEHRQGHSSSLFLYACLIVISTLSELNHRASEGSGGSHSLPIGQNTTSSSAELSLSSWIFVLPFLVCKHLSYSNGRASEGGGGLHSLPIGQNTTNSSAELSLSSRIFVLPRFRWRWERKDLNSGHPLIAKSRRTSYGRQLASGRTHKPSIPHV